MTRRFKMTHDTSKPKKLKDTDAVDTLTAREAIIAGIVDGTILNISNAVAATGASNGGEIQGLYEELKAESDMLSGVADASAAEGKYIDEIIKDINAVATEFNGEDIKTMKVEVYGTVTAWKQAMIPDAE